MDRGVSRLPTPSDECLRSSRWTALDELALPDRHDPDWVAWAEENLQRLLASSGVDVEPIPLRRLGDLVATAPMARSLHVRLDPSSEAALGVVRASGMTDSEAVRTALREAANRRRARASVAEEARLLAEDSADREEMQTVRELMTELRPDWPE